MSPTRKKSASKKSAAKAIAAKKAAAAKKKAAAAKKKAAAAKKKAAAAAKKKAAAAKKKAAAAKKKAAEAKKKAAEAKKKAAEAAKKKTAEAKAAEAAAKEESATEEKAEKQAAKKRPRARLKAPAPTGPRHPKLGYKYACFSCGIKFYDLNKPEPICPKCEANQLERPGEPAPPPIQRPKRTAVRPMAPLLDDDDDIPVRSTNFEDELGVGHPPKQIDGMFDSTIDPDDLEDAIEPLLSDEPEP